MGVVVINRNNGVESVIFYSVDMRYLCECYGDG